jgi:hypothetical protein
MPTFLILLLAIAVMLTAGILFPSRLPRPYRDRVCQGRDWKREFPNASKGEIRSFLALFADAFAFDADDRLKLHPNDLPIDIYRKRYPSQLNPDALEFETLAIDFERSYGVRLEAIWKDAFTLGDLFTAARMGSCIRNSIA